MEGRKEKKRKEKKKKKKKEIGGSRLKGRGKKKKFC